MFYQSFYSSKLLVSIDNILFAYKSSPVHKPHILMVRLMVPYYQPIDWSIQRYQVLLGRPYHVPPTHTYHTFEFFRGLYNIRQNRRVYTNIVHLHHRPTHVPCTVQLALQLTSVSQALFPNTLGCKPIPMTVRMTRWSICVRLTYICRLTYSCWNCQQ